MYAAPTVRAAPRMIPKNIRIRFLRVPINEFGQRPCSGIAAGKGQSRRSRRTVFSDDRWRAVALKDAHASSISVPHNLEERS